MYLQDSTTQPPGTPARENGPPAEVGPEAAAAHGSVPGAQVSRDNLSQCFTDDALALRDRYILDDVLAVGASCIVYQGRNRRGAAEEGSSANVAIKALRPELRSDAAASERLRREFRSCAALRHPNVLRVFALEEASGTWFLVMESLDGESLARLIYNSTPNPLPLSRTLGILRACSAVLSLIHERRMVHRDLNPANVWITGSGEVRVIGFGAARRCVAGPDAELDSDENGGRRLSCATTSGYGGPQVLAGEPAQSADDVFSFACIAYELLVGRHPFGRWNVVESEALHPGSGRPRGLRRPVWRALEEGMHRRSGQRTGSAAELLFRLERGLAQEHSAPRGAVVEGLVRYLADARGWFEPRILERAGSLGNWLGAQRARLAHAVGTARRSVARLPSLPGRAGRQTARVGGFALPHVATLERASRRLGPGFAQAKAQARHLRGLLVSKRARITRGALRVVGVWRETGRGALARMRHRREWAPGAWYRPAGATVLALACLTLVHGKSTFTASSGSALGASGTPDARIHAAPWLDDSLGGFRSDTNARAFGSADECGLASVAIPGRGCAFASMAAASESHAVRASNRLAHRPWSRVTLERGTLTVSDRAIAAVLVVTRAGAVRDPVMVRWRTVVGTAKPGEDYEGVTSGTARFIDNQSVRVLYVPLKPNPNAPGDRSFAVELSRPSSGAALGQIWRSIVTIQKHP
jgi:protein kinase-like protein/Calx-beta domain-containing protein